MVDGGRHIHHFLRRARRSPGCHGATPCSIWSLSLPANAAWSPRSSGRDQPALRDPRDEPRVHLGLDPAHGAASKGHVRRPQITSMAASRRRAGTE